MVRVYALEPLVISNFVGEKVVNYLIGKSDPPTMLSVGKALDSYVSENMN